MILGRPFQYQIVIMTHLVVERDHPKSRTWRFRIFGLMAICPDSSASPPRVFVTLAFGPVKHEKSSSCACRRARVCVCVLCAVCCVMCAVCCVLCAVCCVLCGVCVRVRAQLGLRDVAGPRFGTEPGAAHVLCVSASETQKSWPAGDH